MPSLQHLDPTPAPAFLHHAVMVTTWKRPLHAALVEGMLVAACLAALTAYLPLYSMHPSMLPSPSAPGKVLGGNNCRELYPDLLGNYIY